jgi:hypothetical protein
MRSVTFMSNTPRVSQFTLISVLAPLITLASTVSAQVSLKCPADVTVSNDPGVCSAVVDFPDPTVTGTNTGDIVTVAPPSGSTFPAGTNEVVVTVTSGGTNLADCSFLVVVEDTEPPSINDLSLSRTRLWPPNHKMVNVTVRYEVVDNCDPATETTLTVTSNEPANGTGDGNTSTDWIVIDAHHVQLRSERAGNGDGRTYTITVTSTDSSGNTATQDVTIGVPHDQGKHLGNQGNPGDDNGNGNGKGKGKGKGHGHGHGP